MNKPCQDEEEDGKERRQSSQLDLDWHNNNSSRIIRVSRSSGGKDRHSKVLTSRGLRDRRIRLSVSTAIQFYDLQDRLGYDQPSKAMDWLIKAAADPISELPSLNNVFPNFPHVSFPKPACSSSTSETSKVSGSALSLSRTEVRTKARERARERASKEKEKETYDFNMTPFNEFNALDYFNIMNSSRAHDSYGLCAQTQMGNSFHVVETHQDMQNFSIVNPDHVNFTISPSFAAGLNGGTLQSNFPFVWPYIQRFNPSDGPNNFPFFIEETHGFDTKGKGKN